MRNGLPLFLILPSILALCLAGCGGDDPTGPGDGGDEVTLTPLSEEIVGTAGDTLTVADALTIAIPTLALDGDTSITLGVYDNPPAPPEGRRFFGPVYNIGPEGTDFAVRAKVTLFYDDDDMNGVSESGLVMYTRSDAVWSRLPTGVDTMSDEAQAYVMHLSDFALTLADGEDADGVYAVFDVSRSWYWSDLEGLVSYDAATARFDASVNPDQAVSPLHPDSVSIDAVSMVWDSNNECYITPRGESHDLQGAEFSVFGNLSVPSMAVDHVFPNGQLSFGSEAYEISGSLEGFDITWSGYGVDGDVTLVISDSDTGLPRVEIETDNDGLYTFTAEDLADLTPGQYLLAVAKSVEEAISVTGFDPASRIRSTISALALLELTSPTTLIGPFGGQLRLGDEGLLSFGSGAFSAYHLMRADVDAAPAEVPAWTMFVSAAYDVTPSDIAIEGTVEVLFTWDDGDLMGYDESSITVYVDTGSGWTALSTMVDTTENMAGATVTELGSFAIMISVI